MIKVYHYSLHCILLDSRCLTVKIKVIKQSNYGQVRPQWHNKKKCHKYLWCILPRRKCERYTNLTITVLELRGNECFFFSENCSVSFLYSMHNLLLRQVRFIAYAILNADFFCKFSRPLLTIFFNSSTVYEKSFTRMRYNRHISYKSVFAWTCALYRAICNRWVVNYFVANDKFSAI